MRSSVIVVDPSADRPDADIWFALPAGFVQVPLVELAEAGTEPGSDRQQLMSWLTPIRRWIEVLAQSGVIHCSMGLHRDDQGKGVLLPSLFTLSWREIAWAPRHVTAARIALGMQDAADHVETLDLPCGPAVLVETRTQVAADVPQELLQLTAHVPYPDATKLAVLTLATTAVHRADDYRNLLRETAGMVTFENPFQTRADEV